MFKSLAALAILGAASAPAMAQTTPAQVSAVNQAQPAQPQMVKKRICEDNDDPATTIHRVCKTVMVPAKPNASPSGSQQPHVAQPQPGN